MGRRLLLLELWHFPPRFVTDARVAEKLKDDLLEDKAALLQELPHRIANSLQIIASVIMRASCSPRRPEHTRSTHTSVSCRSPPCHFTDAYATVLPRIVKCLH